jgi:hypothetical protein
MKKNLIILTLALVIALPVFGLAVAELTTSVAPEVQTTETTPVATAPQTGFLDADNDGVCDNCGNALGTNSDAPNYIDENNDGVCDHFGTTLQGQRQGRMQGMMGRGQGMMARGQQGQGNTQCPNYADVNNDGVCDNLGTGTQQNFGCGSNRR